MRPAPDRRGLLALTGAALLTGGTVAAAAAPRPVDAGAPPQGPDAYGFKGRIAAPEPFERALRMLGEPALLTRDAVVKSPTFRLLELHSLRKPRAARIIFAEPDGSMEALLKYAPLTDPRGASLQLDAQRGIRLRALIDDRERFWDGACEPPDWDRMAAEKPGVVVVWADGGASLLEARVGAKRHLILRSNAAEDSLLSQLSKAVFGEARR